MSARWRKKARQVISQPGPLNMNLPLLVYLLVLLYKISNKGNLLMRAF